MRIAGQTIDQLERTDAAHRGPTAADASKKTSAGDSVQLSSASEQARASLQAADAARSERVEALREQVARGEYTVDFARLADSMAREEGARAGALQGDDGP